MPIQTACSSCSAKIRVKDELIGKAVKCPRCGKPIANLTKGEGVGTGAVDQNPTRTAPGVAPAAAPGGGEPQTLGGYRILRKLGQGGMGAVYEAEDLKLKRHVALKVMKPEIAQHQDHRERFLREARTAAKVESDFICPIYRVGEDNGVPFIAMPFLKGEPLDAHLKQGRRLQVSEIIHVGTEVAQGLSAAHEAGLVHRDIKPANIWLETQRSGPARAVILDFGLARKQVEDVHLTQTGAVLGTPAYMSPEQGRGEAHVDARTDLFSLGCVLYVLCTGELPFKGETTLGVLTALATQNPTPPHKLGAPISKRLSSLIMRLLAKDPDDRPQTALEVIEELREIEADIAQPPTVSFTTQNQPPKLSDTSGPKSTGAGETANRRPPPLKRETPYALFAVIALGLFGCVITLAGGVGVYYFVNAGDRDPDPVVVEGKRSPDKVEEQPEPIVIKGTLTREDSQDEFGAVRGRFHRVHLVPLESGQHYLIELEGTFDTYLRIEDTDNKVIQLNDDVCPPNDLNSRSVFIPKKKNTYRLVVTSFKPQETGSYTLSVQKAVNVDDVMTIKGHLGGEQPAPAVHRFKLVGGNPYTLELTSANFDASFAFSSGGQLVAYATPGNPARMDFTPAANGDYSVTLGRAGDAGEYTLSIQRYETPKRLPGTGLLHPKKAPAIYDAGAGVELRGQIDKQNPTVVYHVLLAAGKTYTIDMISPNAKAVDPYLMLTDAAGNKLAEDDDSGGNLNARIVFQAKQAGVFSIHASSFNRGAGPFTLTVRETVDAKQPNAVPMAGPMEARGHAARGDWKAAAAAYARYFADRQLSNGEYGFEYAAVLVLSGDPVGYRRICTEMLDRSGQLEVRPFHAARACTLAPASVKEAALAGMKAEGEFKQFAKAHWSLTEQGALAYRAGRYDEAAMLLEQSLKADTRPGILMVSWCWLSLVEHRRDKPAEARAWLDKATKWLEQFPNGVPVLEDDVNGIHLHTWLETQVLRREAEMLLVPNKP